MSAVDFAHNGVEAAERGHEVGEYDGRRLDVGGDLTDRQFEALLAAVDRGYYDSPRQGPSRT